MKYFIDTEFLEGTQKGLFKETRPTIDLISIGIVAEGGGEYYAISKDFNLKEAWNRYDIKKDFDKPQGLGDVKVYWIRDNVLKPIWEELVRKELDVDILGELENPFTYKGLTYLINKYGKTNNQIATEVYDFVSEATYNNNGFNASLNENLNPEFYGYYADYDWVVFCWLFGRTIDLPEGFPMCCIDLKQELDNKADRLRLPNTELSKEQMIETIKGTANYPKQTNEHNALADARWNYELYKFLNKI